MKKKTAVKVVSVEVENLAALYRDLQQLNNTLDKLRGDLEPDEHRFFCAECDRLGVNPFA